MSFTAFVGQEKAKTLLQNGLREQKISHAYLFSGPPGTGKKQMAWTFAQSLLCVQNKADACGQCIECRKIEHGNHPDIALIQAEGSSIKIEQIRQLQRQFTYRSNAGKYRIYIIHQAELMTTQAANSLLKFLEEPQPGIVAILLSDNEQMLLPTIRSRVMWVPFFPLTAEHMSRALLAEGEPEELVHVAVHLSAGLAGVKKFIRLPEFAEIRNVVIQLGEELFRGPAAVSLFIQKQVMKSNWQDQIGLFLDMLVLWLKDMVHVLAGRADKVVFRSQFEQNRKLAYSRSIAAWIRDVEYTLEARKKLRYHNNPQLVLEQLMFRIQEG